MKKILRLMIITFSIVLMVSLMSIRGDSAILHLSNALKSAEIDTLGDNLENDITYNTSIFVSENSTEFLLTFSDKSEQDIVINWVTNNLNAEIIAISNYTSLMHFKTNEIKGFEVQSLVNTQQDFSVKYIQDYPDGEFHDTWIPNDPYLGNQWYIDKIKAKEAWFYERGSSSVKVAVLDTGCDMDHPDLEDNLDTWSDWDYIGGDSDPNPRQGFWDHANNAHGTNCAGLIAAVQNNNKGIAGLAEVYLVNFRIGYFDFWGYDHISWTGVVDAIYRAVDYSHADIISMSFGDSSYIEALYDATLYAWEEGVLVVASAGNSNGDLDSYSYNIYPAEWDHVMCVAATDENDNKASFSNYGDQKVDICAPGTNIYTTHWKGGYTSSFRGTSASAPIVAGVAALVLSHNSGYSLTTLWNALVDEADDVGNPQIRGRVNAYYSVINYWVPSSYQKTPGATLTGSYHSGSLSNLKKVDSLYFTWCTDWVKFGPLIYVGFSVDFYFPVHYISRLKIALSFGGKTCNAKIYWFGGGSSTVSFSESLNYDCNFQRIDHITISYFGSAGPTYVYFDRVILVGP